jgi:hypothetical protein
MRKYCKQCQVYHVAEWYQGERIPFPCEREAALRDLRVRPLPSWEHHTIEDRMRHAERLHQQIRQDMTARERKRQQEAEERLHAKTSAALQDAIGDYRQQAAASHRAAVDATLDELSDLTAGIRAAESYEVQTRARAIEERMRQRRLT